MVSQQMVLDLGAMIFKEIPSCSCLEALDAGRIWEGESGGFQDLFCKDRLAWCCY